MTTRSPSYEHLLRSAGFHDIVSVDLTDGFLDRLKKWLRYGREHEEELAAAYPEFGTLLEERFAARTVVREGLLQRALYVAQRP